MKIKINLLTVVFLTMGGWGLPMGVKAAMLDSLPTGAAIQMTGQGGAVYKFIKMIPKDDDGNTMPHSDGASGSYWMLADNYCGLTGRPSDCMHRASSGITTSNVESYWNPTLTGTVNNWTTMASTQYGVYSQVLTPFYNDLPTTIGGLVKNSAILTKAYPMSSITAVGGNIGEANKSSCYLTAGSVGTGTANTVDCTWTDKISLPSYADWQNGLGGYSIYYTSGNANAYSMTRFGVVWDSSNKFSNWSPWFRSPLATSNDHVWRVSGNSSTNSVRNNAADDFFGVSPVIWLSSSITTIAGSGTYQKPYCLNGDTRCNLIMTSPAAVWNNNNQTLSVTGNVNYSASGEAILIWAAACNSAGECKQKTTTVTSNGSSQAYNLTWLPNELSAGEYDGTIWVGAHIIASASDEANAFNQSNTINFTISPRTMDLSVTKNRPFNLSLGDAAIFNLTPGTNQGVTVAVDSTTNDLLISGTLTQDTQIPFGSIILNFKTFEIPQSVVINDSLSLQ